MGKTDNIESIYLKYKIQKYSFRTFSEFSYEQLSAIQWIQSNYTSLSRSNFGNSPVSDIRRSVSSVDTGYTTLLHFLHN